MTALGALFAFLIILSLLVAVHEFGHLWVAKKCGVKVLRFSIGFGKILKSWRLGETEYALSALPFGGYVKMLDEREAAVSEDEKHRAFNRQNVYKKIAIAAAGPLANFAFAFLIYTLIFYAGVAGVKPIIGAVETNTPAEHAGLSAGQEIIAVNKNEVRTISEFIESALKFSDQKIILETVDENQNIRNHEILADDYFLAADATLENHLGFEFATPALPAVIAEVLPGSAAEKSGVEPGDKILKINETKIENWRDVVQNIQQNQNALMGFEILRGGQKINLQIQPENQKIGVKVLVDDAILKKWRVVVKRDFINSAAASGAKILFIVQMTGAVVKKMILGEASFRHLSGPVAIADYGGKSFAAGWISFLSFLALISVSLGIINLLPIPMLDGGHILMFVIEIFKGAPVGEKTEQILLKFGVFFIAGLTALVLYNDITRILQ